MYIYYIIICASSCLLTDVLCLSTNWINGYYTVVEYMHTLDTVLAYLYVFIFTSILIFYILSVNLVLRWSIISKIRVIK